MTDVGPYETEAQARGQVHHIYAAAHTSRSPGVMDDGNHRLLCDTLVAAGVQAGAYDHEIVRWLARYEPQMVAVVAGLIARARQAGALSADDVALVLDALDVAADHKRETAAYCPECEARPEGLCPTCDWRLDRAREYDALAARIGGQR